MKRSENPQAGFTLVEVMLASAVSLLIFLVMFEAMFFARRVAAENKLRLAADAAAYDLTMNLFNRDLTSWFEKLPVSQEWTETGIMKASSNHVWYGDVTYVRSVVPDGIPVTNWIIRTSIQWPNVDGVIRSFNTDQYVLYRQRSNR